jgi:hypothetical protein
MTGQEWRRGLEDLIAWVEEGEQPEGDDVFEEFADLGGRFTLAPRQGTEAGDSVDGAADRVTLTGAITVNGQPMEDGGYVWFEVHTDGLRAICNFLQEPVRDGRYTTVIAASSEVSSCGRPGSTVYAGTYEDGDFHLAGPMEWPEGTTATFDVAFSTTGERVAAPTTYVFGVAQDASREPLPAGTKIEALINGTVCGLAYVPPVVMETSEPGLYSMDIVTAADIAGCEEGATVRFRVDGEDVEATVTHAPGPEVQNVDMVLPE